MELNNTYCIFSYVPFKVILLVLFSNFSISLEHFHFNYLIPSPQLAL